MQHPIPVTLSETDRASLQTFIHAGKASARSFARAYALLKAADGWTDERICETFSISRNTSISQECRVLSGSQDIGTIQGLPDLESIIGLAGYAWRVISVDERGRTVHVERAKGVVKASWLTFGDVHFHERVMRRLRQALQEETMYAYLSSLAQQRLALTRELARRSDWLRSCVVRLEPGRFALFHWTGWRICSNISAGTSSFPGMVRTSKSSMMEMRVLSSPNCAN